MMNYIYDIAAVFLFIAFLLYGYRRGLLRTLLQFASSVIAIVLSYLLLNPFTDWLTDLGFFQKTTDSITNSVGEQFQSVGDNVVSPLTNFMPERWARGIIMQTEPAQESLAVQAGEATARLFLGAIAFLILFLVLRAILGGVASAVSRILDHIPLLGWANRLGGLLLGGIFGLITIWLITMILTALAVNYETLHSALSSSMILDFFSDKDIFMSLLDTII
ncbi:MAG: CvpA family protein [Eubacteriales bacterium]|nr:CvpA family protein [Eubacteriales bacterium]